MSNRPLLSILINSIPSRFTMMQKLYEHLQAAAVGKDIEIVVLIDNKTRSIGMKREALKNLSQGKYFMFCDDDDWIASLEEIYQAAASDVDVITFKTRCRNNSGSYFIVTSRLGNEIEHTNDGKGNYLDLKRPPFPMCPWNEKYRGVEFPDTNCGEDWGWAEQALRTATSEIFIDAVITHYNHDPKVSEA